MRSADDKPVSERLHPMSERISDGCPPTGQSDRRGSEFPFAVSWRGMLSNAIVAAIDAVADPGVLTDLVTALGKARSAAEARAALNRALAG